MNHHDVEYYSKYHQAELERQGANERQARRALANQKPSKRKGHNPLMLLLINLLNLIRGF